MRLRHLALGVIVASLSFSTVALAQGRDPGLRAQVRQRVRVRIEQQVAAALALDPATAQRVNALIDRDDAAVAALQEDSGKARRQIKQILDGGGADSASINRLADRILDNRTRMEELQGQRSRALRQILTPQQYGKLILEYPKITRTIRAEIWRAMAARRGAMQQPDDEQPGE
ncbi:MAG: hypothetical protein ACHQ17_05155 [Polyangia bacterium]|jgi:Spy/CpxP family protein refolding chaperone